MRAPNVFIKDIFDPTDTGDPEAQRPPQTTGRFV
jgi:hypothetical protein